MPIPADEFRAWTESVGLEGNVAKLAAVAGVKRATLYGQLFRDQVLETVVVAICRSLSLDPLDALSGFSAFTFLTSTTAAPTAAELRSQLHYKDVLGELLSRVQGETSALGEVRGIPFQNSVRSWFDTIDPGKMRSVLAQQFGVTEAAISIHLSSNKFSPKMATAAALHAGVSTASSLVVIGLLTEDEGRWPLDGRAKMLTSMTDVELIDQASYWLAFLRRSAVAASKEKAVIDSVWEHLG